MTELCLTQQLMHSGNLVLVNADYQTRNVQSNLSLALAEFPDVLMNREAASLLCLILKEQNLMGKIVLVSGYRSQEEQTAIYNNSLRENGAEFTRSFVAQPGHSEHQTGLAIDLGIMQDQIDFIRPDFPYEGASQEFRKAAAHYGFVERYPKSKERITGIAHEPWHFRYVGRTHAEIMTEGGFVLEEYVGFIRCFRYNNNPYHVCLGDHEYWISFIGVDQKQMNLTLDSNLQSELSGNNVDGWILTQWR